MYYDEFDPSDGVWYSIQNMAKNVEQLKDASELATSLRNMSDSDIRAAREAYEEMLSGFSQISYELMNARSSSHRLSTLYDRVQKAETKLRSLTALLKKPVDRRTDEQRRADEERKKVDEERKKEEQRIRRHEKLERQKHQKEQERENAISKYDNYIQEKNQAHQRTEFEKLAKKFHIMGDYKDAEKFARECEDAAAIIRKREAEEKRIKDERIAEEKRIKDERIEEERRAKADAKKAKNKKFVILSFLTFAVFIVYLFALFPSYFRNLHSLREYGDIGWFAFTVRLFIPLAIFAIASGLFTSINQFHGRSGVNYIFGMIFIYPIAIGIIEFSIAPSGGIIWRILALIAIIIIGFVASIPGAIIEELIGKKRE